MHRQRKYKAITPGVAWLLNNLQIESPYGREALKKLEPARSQQLTELEQSFDELAAIVDFITAHPDFTAQTGSIFKCLRNISGSLDNLGRNSVPDETELLEIKNFALLISSLEEILASFGLKTPGIEFQSLQKVIKLLNPDQTVVYSFHIHEAYSDKLKQIRQDKQRLENAILKAVSPAAKDSLRSERALIVQHEKEEECLVRADLGKKLLNWLPQLRHNTAMAGRLELLLARGQLAVSRQSCRPSVFMPDCGRPAVVRDAVNPEVAEILERQGKSFTPVSLELIRGTTLVTGANMGGKTVALMTVAMNAELVALGFFPFAREFSMPLFDFIYLIVGDSQSADSGLSSFGAEIIRLSELTALIGKGIGLAICDEFARSTNPSEGSRFVRALSDFLQQSGSYGLISTHYDGIETEGAAFYQVIGLKNKSMPQHTGVAADRSTVLNNLCTNMDYRLVKIEGHYEVPKDALRIATILETDQRFLEHLKKYYPPQ